MSSRALRNSSNSMILRTRPNGFAHQPRGPALEILARCENDDAGPRRLHALVRRRAQHRLHCKQILGVLGLPRKVAIPIWPDHLQNGKVGGVVIPESPAEVVCIDTLGYIHEH